MPRDDFTTKTKEVLAKRVANTCSRPGCNKKTSGPHSEETKHISLGVAAHITAASKDGPRYDASLTPEQRKAPSNGIWLCQNCAKLVDNDESQYPTELLHQWKQEAEDKAHAELEGRCPPDSDTPLLQYSVNDWTTWRRTPEPPNSPVVILDGWSPGDLRFSFKLRIRNNRELQEELHSIRLEYREQGNALHTCTYAIQPDEIALPSQKWTTIEVSYGLHDTYESNCSTIDSIWFAAETVGFDHHVEFKLAELRLSEIQDAV